MAEITVLRCADKGKIAAKTIKLGADGNVEKINFKAGTWFNYSKVTIDDIEQLSAFLKKTASDNHSLLIRGILSPNKDPNQLVRRLGVKGHGENGYFQSHPEGQPWLLLDFDGIPTTSAIDFIKQPLKGIEYLVSLLPSHFHGVSHHYHLSSGAGLDGGKTIRAHIWYWLDKPVHDDMLRVWANGINCHGKLIDAALFNTVQPHYTADPIFDGVSDPFLGKRSGFVTGKTGTVILPKVVPNAYTSVGSASGLSPSEAFTHFLNAVGDHEGGIGFHEPLRQAAWYYVLEHGVDGTDKVALKQALRDAIAKADQSKHSPAAILDRASDAHLDPLIDGAFVKLHAQGKNGPHKYLPPHYPAKKVLSSSQATDELGKHIRSFFETPRNMGIKASAGLGKTTKVLAKLRNEMLDDKKIEIYVPTHELGKQVAKIINESKSGIKLPHQEYAHSMFLAQVIAGREQPTKSGKSCYCLKKDVATGLGALGIPIYPNLCRNKTYSCEYYNQCEYIRQFSQEYDVRVYTHAHIGLDRGFLDKDLPDYAIIDESFFRSLLVGVNLKSKPITLSEIKAASWPKELRDAFLLAPPEQPLLAYLRTQLGEDGLQDCIQHALDEKVEKIDIDMIHLSLSGQLAIVGELKAKSRLKEFLEVLQLELLTGRDICHGIHYQEESPKLNLKEGYALRYRRPITRFKGKKDGADYAVPVLAIDADLSEPVHRQFYPDTEFHEILTERNCHVIQCYSTKNSKTSLTHLESKDKTIADIQKAVDSIAKDQPTLVLGPEIITGNPKKNIPSQIAVPQGSALNHFGNIRGSDAYNKKNAIVVVGQNNPPVNGIEGVARALWFDSEEPLKLGLEKLIQEPRGYRTSTGYKVGVNVSVHPDPRVQMLLELTREAETLQGIDRLRLIHEDKGKQVYLFSNLVLDLTVNNLLDWPEMIEGTTRLNDAWHQEDGVLPLSDYWLAERFPKLFNTKDAAGSYLTRIGNQLGCMSNSIIIKSPTRLKLYTYKVSGQTGPAPRCLSKYGPKETASRLQTLLGKAIDSISEADSKATYLIKT